MQGSNKSSIADVYNSSSSPSPSPRSLPSPASRNTSTNASPYASPGGASHDPLSPFPSPSSRRHPVPPLTLPARTDAQGATIHTPHTLIFQQATSVRSNPSLPTRSLNSPHAHPPQVSYPVYLQDGVNPHPLYYSYPNQAAHIPELSQTPPAVPSEYPYYPIIPGQDNPYIHQYEELVEVKPDPSLMHSPSHQGAVRPSPHRPRVRVNREALRAKRPHKVEQKVVYLQPSSICLQLISAPPPHLTLTALHTLLIENDNEKEDMYDRRVKSSAPSKEPCPSLSKFILAHIFSFGDISDFRTWSLVSKLWSEAMHERSLWEWMCSRDLGTEFCNRIFHRLSSSINDEPFRIVYRWSMPPKDITSAPCLSCGTDGGQKLENVFICRACSRLPLYTVVTRRQLSMQYKLPSADIAELFPTSGLRHNAFLMKSVFKALFLRRRNFLHRQLRALRLSTHYKYHLFFHEFVNDPTLRSSAEDQVTGVTLVENFKKLLLEYAVHFAMHHPAARAAYTVASKMNLTSMPPPTLESYEYTHGFVGSSPQETQFLQTLDYSKPSPRPETRPSSLSSQSHPPDYTTHSDTRTVVSSTMTTTTKTITSASTQGKNPPKAPAATTPVSPRAVAHHHAYINPPSTTYPFHPSVAVSPRNTATPPQQTQSSYSNPRSYHAYPSTLQPSLPQLGTLPQPQASILAQSGYEPYVGGPSPRIPPAQTPGVYHHTTQGNHHNLYNPPHMSDARRNAYVNPNNESPYTNTLYDPQYYEPHPHQAAPAPQHNHLLPHNAIPQDQQEMSQGYHRGAAAAAHHAAIHPTTTLYPPTLANNHPTQSFGNMHQYPPWASHR